MTKEFLQSRGALFAIAINRDFSDKPVFLFSPLFSLVPADGVYGSVENQKVRSHAHPII